MTDRTIRVKVEAKATGVGELERAGAKLSRVGSAMTVGLTLPLVAAGAAAFAFASDADEAMSKATRVYGDAAGAIVRESENMADAFSQATFLDTAGTFGALLTNMGLTEQAAADQSIAWLKLAQDMASFHNVDPTQALGAIQSALAGEFEPLKQFGVMLNVATLEAKALEMGLWDGTGALTEQAKIQVINAELYGQQAKVIGDFAATSDGAANKTRILTSNFTDAAASLGEKLLPIGTDLLNLVNDWITAFSDLTPEQQETIVKIAGLVAALGPAIFVLGKVVGAVNTVITVVRGLGVALQFLALNPVGLLVVAIGALAFLIITNFDAIKRGVGVVLDFLGSAIGKVARVAGELFDPVADAFVSVIDVIRGAWNLFARFWNAIQISVPSFDVAGVRVGGFDVGLPDLPVLDTGAIVTGPTLAALAQNNRPEAVVPLRRGALGGDLTVIVQTGVGDPVAIGRELADVLAEYSRTVGPLPIRVAA